MITTQHQNQRERQRNFIRTKEVNSLSHKATTMQTRKRAGMGVMTAALFTGTLLCLSQAASAVTSFTENFETGWTNNVDGNLGTGASTGGWTLRDAPRYSLQTSPSPQDAVLQFNGGAHNQSWWWAGTQHGVTPQTNAQGNTELLISGEIRQAPTNDARDLAWLWLANSVGDGYGVFVTRGGSSSNNVATVFKSYGGTNPLSGTPTLNMGSANNNGFFPVSSSVVGITNNDFINFHVSLEQAAAGAPVTMNLWSTGSNTNNTSYETPLMTWVDDGTLTGAGGALDLTNLTWVLLTAENYNNTTDVTQFDNIMVQTVPEPSTVALLVLGGAAVLIARRRWR
jgi:hypothetical protein